MEENPILEGEMTTKHKSVTPAVIALFVLMLVGEVILGVHGSNSLIQYHEDSRRVEELQVLKQTLSNQLALLKDTDFEKGSGYDERIIVTSTPRKQKAKPSEEEFRVRIISTMEALAKAQNDYDKADLSIDELKLIAASMDVYLAEDSVDGRTPWSTSDPDTSWVSCPPLLEEQDNYPVMWLNTTQDGDITDVCTATYDDATQTFSKMSWVRVGNDSVPVETYSDDFEEEVME